MGIQNQGRSHGCEIQRKFHRHLPLEGSTQTCFQHPNYLKTVKTEVESFRLSPSSSSKHMKTATSVSGTSGLRTGLTPPVTYPVLSLEDHYLPPLMRYEQMRPVSLAVDTRKSRQTVLPLRWAPVQGPSEHPCGTQAWRTQDGQHPSLLITGHSVRQDPRLLGYLHGSIVSS